MCAGVVSPKGAEDALAALMSEAGMEGQAARLRKLKARHYNIVENPTLCFVRTSDLCPCLAMRKRVTLAAAMAAPFQRTVVITGL